MHRGSVRALRRQNASSSDVVLHVRDETGPHGVAGAPSAQARRRGCRRTSDVGRRDCSDRIKTAMRCVVAVCSCAPLRCGDQRPRCVCVCVHPPVRVRVLNPVEVRRRDLALYSKASRYGLCFTPACGESPGAGHRHRAQRAHAHGRATAAPRRPQSARARPTDSARPSQDTTRIPR